MMSRFTMIGVLAIITLAACQPTDVPPEQRLEQLRAEKAKIDEQIRDLERELGTENNGSAVPVTIHTVAVGPFRHLISVKGTVDSRSTVDVSPQTGGRIVAINVSNGQTVSKGQILMELDAELVKRSIAEVRTQLDFASTLYEKQKRIYDKQAGSEIQYLQAKNNKEALERRLEALDEQLSLSRIAAPTSGTIDNLTLSTGEMAMPGMPVLTIVNTSDMRVVADLAEPYISTVNVGDAVTVTFSDIDKSITTAVSIVARTVNSVNRTFRVEIPIRPVPPMLRPNTTADVQLNDQTIDQTIGIPLAAILREGAVQYVLVVDTAGVAHRREITTGLVSGAEVQVTSGLEAGDRVVVRGNQDVTDGQNVRVIE